MDTFRIIGLYTNEANMEGRNIMASPTNYVDMRGNPIRSLSREAGMGLFMLTKD